LGISFNKRETIYRVASNNTIKNNFEISLVFDTPHCKTTFTFTSRLPRELFVVFVNLNPKAAFFILAVSDHMRTFQKKTPA